MKNKTETIVKRMNALTKEGYTEDFVALENFIQGTYNKKEYHPDDLLIVDHYRYEGETDPSDQTALYAVEATDGTKGTITMSYNYDHNHNIDLIKKIKERTK